MAFSETQIKLEIDQSVPENLLKKLTPILQQNGIKKTKITYQRSDLSENEIDNFAPIKAEFKKSEKCLTSNVISV